MKGSNIDFTKLESIIKSLCENPILEVDDGKVIDFVGNEKMQIQILAELPGLYKIFKEGIIDFRNSMEVSMALIGVCHLCREGDDSECLNIGK